MRVPVHFHENNEKINVSFGSGNTITYNDYEKLKNKPSINGVVLEGNVTLDQLGFKDATYIHHQQVASNEWVIQHNRDEYPSVTIVDSGGNTVVGDVQYVDSNNLIVRFSAIFSGKAYLN